MRPEGMNLCHRDSTQRLARSKDRAASALTCQLPNSVVLGQSLLTEKHQTADSPRFGHANKKPCKKESAETAKQW